MSSRLIQVTVVPTATVRVCGPKLKLSILTSAVDAGACGTVALTGFVAPNTPTKRNAAAAARLQIDTLLLMIFLPLFLFLNYLLIQTGARFRVRLRANCKSI